MNYRVYYISHDDELLYSISQSIEGAIKMSDGMARAKEKLFIVEVVTNKIIKRFDK